MITNAAKEVKDVVSEKSNKDITDELIKESEKQDNKNNEEQQILSIYIDKI